MSSPPTIRKPSRNTPTSPLEIPELKGWKSGLEFDPSETPRKKGESPSRYSKRIHRQKKGTFIENVKKVEDAPSLCSVVNAKCEIKQRATAEVVERAKKREEEQQQQQQQQRGKAYRVHIKKESPPAMKPGSWTNVFSPDPYRLLSPSLQKARRPKGYKPPPGSFKVTDWSNAYQQIDLLSPTSGKPKMIAKQDLVLRDRIMSPKKKTHSKSEKKNRNLSRIPSLDLLDMKDDDEDEDDEDDDDEPIGRNSTKPTLSITDDDNSSDDDEDLSRNDPLVPTVTPVSDRSINTDNNRDGKSYSSFQEEGQQTSTSRKKQPSSSSSSKTTTKSSTKPKQLILEFNLSPGGKEEPVIHYQVPVDLADLDDVSSVGSWPSIESDDSDDTKLNKMMQRWMASVEDDDPMLSTMDDPTNNFDENIITLEDNVLDHITLGVPDLDSAMDEFEDMTGIRPTVAGPLKGLGVKTAHVTLDGNRFLELMAPDHENPGSLGKQLSHLEKDAIVPFYYSIRSSELSRLIEGYVYDVLGWDSDHIAMVQVLPDNTIRHWDMLTMYGHDMGGVAPCYVKWKDPSRHPSMMIDGRPMKAAATLTSFKVQAPEDHKVHKLIMGVNGLEPTYGTNPEIELTIQTIKGSFHFSSFRPKGLTFPGYEDKPHHLLANLSHHLPLNNNSSNSKSGGGRTVDEDYLDVGSESYASSMW